MGRGSINHWFSSLVQVKVFRTVLKIRKALQKETYTPQTLRQIDRRRNNSAHPLATVARGMLVRHEANLAMPAFEGTHLEFHRLSNHGYFYFLFVESQGRKELGKRQSGLRNGQDSSLSSVVTGWQMGGNHWIPLNLSVGGVTIKPGIQRKLFWEVLWIYLWWNKGYKETGLPSKHW